MSFGESLTNIRKERGISRKDFAEQLDIPYTTLRNYETDQREPGHKLLIRMATLLSVSVDDLIGYHIENKTSQLSLSEQDHIKKYRVLDEHGKEVVDSVLNLEYKYILERRNGNTCQAEGERIITLPLPLQAASAGTGQFSDDEASEDISVVYNEYTSKADYVMRVSGDSMEPKFYDGDLVLVREQPAVEVGEIGIYIIDGDQYIKEYKGDHLHSLNPEYEDVDCTEDTYCRGKVLGVLEEDWVRIS